MSDPKPPQLASSRRLEFFVPGTPRPGGSKRAFVITSGGRSRAVVTDASGQRGRDWRADVREAATAALGGAPPLDGPLLLLVDFWMPRPKHHMRSGRYAGQLKPGAPCWHAGAPDATKLLRSVEDALNGLAWRDDSQVAEQHVRKRYRAERPGAAVVIEAIPASAQERLYCGAVPERTEEA